MFTNHCASKEDQIVHSSKSVYPYLHTPKCFGANFLHIVVSYVLLMMNVFSFVFLQVKISGFETRNNFDLLPKGLTLSGGKRLDLHPQNQCLRYKVDPILMVVLVKPVSSEKNLKKRCLLVGLSSSQIDPCSGWGEVPAQWCFHLLYNWLLAF